MARGGKPRHPNTGWGDHRSRLGPTSSSKDFSAYQILSCRTKGNTPLLLFGGFFFLPITTTRCTYRLGPFNKPIYCEVRIRKRNLNLNISVPKKRRVKNEIGTRVSSALPRTVELERHMQGKLAPTEEGDRSNENVSSAVASLVAHLSTPTHYGPPPTRIAAHIVAIALVFYARVVFDRPFLLHPGVLGIAF